MKWLLICLVLIIAAFIATTFFNVSANTLVYGAILLSCPLMHLLMMKNGGHKH